ncbi:MAG: hypothetical protein ACP5KE_06640 [Candidatus Methanodesulfokora sp.]|jgi:hypothetical protein
MAEEEEEEVSELAEAVRKFMQKRKAKLRKKLIPRAKGKKKESYLMELLKLCYYEFRDAIYAIKNFLERFRKE